MSDERHRRLRTLFLAARELPAGERTEYLRTHCAADPALRAEAEVLLRNDAADGFLERPALGASPPRLADVQNPADAGPGPRIGRYKLLQTIGEGGFGTVYMAEQEDPVRRRVALKVIKPGMDSRRVVARFEAERQALARMDHPNIATVFDGGTTPDGRPYFVMELVAGTPLTEYCDANRLPAAARLELLAAVCGAVQHAHHKGVIHRDLKPSNVLVTLRDGAPVPKVIDFGIAKALDGPLTDKTLFTDFRQLIGTPEYMSPEQAETSAWDADTRSDVYSLGVLLYELLTGTTPFDGCGFRTKALGEIQRTIREVEPPRPSVRLSTLGGALTAVAAHRRIDPRLLRRAVAGDLDRVVMKALEKDRTRRYDSPRALAADLRRYLADEPVEARAPGVGYRCRKWVRRNPLVAALVGLGLFAGFGLAGTVVGLARSDRNAVRAAAAAADADRERTAATESARRADRLAYGNLLTAAEEAIAAGRRGNAAGLLDRCPVDLRGPEWHWMRYRVGDRSVVYRGHVGPVRAVGYFADGRLASAGADGTVRVWDAAGSTVESIAASRRSLTALAVHAGTKSIACGDEDGHIRVWGAGGVKRAACDGTKEVTALRFTPDGAALVSGTADGAVTVRRTDSLAPVHTLPGLTGAVTALEVTPDGRHLLAAGRGGMLLWDVTTGRRLHQHGDYWQRYHAVVRPGRAEVVGLHGGVTVWATDPPRRLRDVPTPAANVTAVAAAGDGCRLLAATADGGVRSVDLDSGETATVALGDQGAIHALAVSPDGARFALAGADGTVRVWACADTAAQIALAPGACVNAALALPGGRVAGIGQDGTLTVWDGRGAVLRSVPAHQGDGLSLDASTDGRRIFTYGLDRAVREWDAGTLEPVRAFGTDWGAREIRLTRDGHSVLAPPPPSDEKGEARLALWAVATGRPGLRFDGLNNWAIRAEFSRDGRWLAAAAQERLCVWDARSGALVHTIASEPTNPCRCVTFTPDGTALVAGYDDGRVCVRAVPTGAPIRTIFAHGDGLSAVRVTADGSRLLTACQSDGRIRVWAVDTGDRVLELPSGLSAVTDLSFAPDETRLLAAGPGGVRVWPLGPGR